MVMTQVVEKGTGGAAAVEGYKVAGKTGTAQKYDQAKRSYSNEKYLAAFAGFAPAEEPRLVVIVMIDEPQESIWGGSVAAPVFRRVVSRALRYLNVPATEGGRILMVES
jgi:cell division protein FtsI (penicillin-binding protein 3)